MEQHIRLCDTLSDIHRDCHSTNLFVRQAPVQSSSRTSASVVVLPAVDNDYYSDENSVISGFYENSKIIVSNSQPKEQQELSYPPGTGCSLSNTSSLFAYSGGRVGQYVSSSVIRPMTPSQISSFNNVRQIYDASSGQKFTFNEKTDLFEHATEVAEAAQILDNSSRNGQDSDSQPNIANNQGAVFPRRPAMQSNQLTRPRVQVMTDMINNQISAEPNQSVLKQDVVGVLGSFPNTKVIRSYDQSQNHAETGDEPMKMLQSGRLIESFVPLVEMIQKSVQSDDSLDEGGTNQRKCVNDDMLSESCESKMCQVDFGSDDDENKEETSEKLNNMVGPSKLNVNSLLTEEEREIDDKKEKGTQRKRTHNDISDEKSDISKKAKNGKESEICGTKIIASVNDVEYDDNSEESGLEESNQSNAEEIDQSDDETGSLDLSCDNDPNIPLAAGSEKGTKAVNATEFIEQETKKETANLTYLRLPRNKHGKFCKANRRGLNLQKYWKSRIEGKDQKPSMGEKEVYVDKTSSNQIHGNSYRQTMAEFSSAQSAVEEDDSSEVTSSDESMNLCRYCETFHKAKSCPVFAFRHITQDSNSYKNSQILSLMSLPSQLVLTSSEVKEHGLAIFAAEKIPIGTRFGPAIGELVEFGDLTSTMDFTHIWITNWKEDNVDTRYLNTEDELKSNWCRYLRPSIDIEECNVVSFIMNKKIYFSTRRNVKPGEELVVYFLFIDSLILLVTKEYMGKNDGYCQRCDHTFKNFVSFAKHVKIYHPKGIMRMKSQCTECKLLFYSNRELGNHCRDEHDGKGAFRCKDCGKYFTKVSELKHHWNMNHYPEGDYPCEQCGKMYKSPFKLKAHLKCIHPVPGKVFKCDICNKQLKSKDMLSRHKQTHDGQYRYSCDRCGKLFRDGTNLKVHFLTHSKVKPFQCQMTSCDSAFTTKQCLQNHYRKNHGFTEDNLPEIIRCIPFTIEAHVGSNDT